MKKYGKKLFALALASGLIVGSVCSVQAAMVGSEEQVEGATVLLEQYCSNVANGTVDVKTSEVLVASEPNATAVTDCQHQHQSRQRIQQRKRTRIHM